MGELEQIFGAALGAGERNREATQGPDAILSPSSIPAIPETSAPSETKEDVNGGQVQTNPMSRLASFVMRSFRTNADHRRESGVDEKLLYAMNANKSVFTEAQINALMNIGIPEVIARKLHTSITSVKTRGAKSILLDIVSQVGEPLFSIEPTPMPDVPKMISREAFDKVARDLESFMRMVEQSGATQLDEQQMGFVSDAVKAALDVQWDETAAHVDAFARKRAGRMQKKVWDLMVEGGWENSAVHECLSNLCIYGTCVLRGPVMRAVEKNVCVDGKNGVVRCVRKVELVPTFESISPWDCYPAPNASQTEDGPFCIKVRYAGHDLWRFCDAAAASDENGEGWNDRAVKDVLDRHPEGGVKLIVESDMKDADRREQENRGREDTKDCDYEGVMCYAFVRGELLAEMGIVKTRLGKNVKVNDYYRVEAIVIDGLVVYCRIVDDRVGFPISKAVFYDFPGSWWGDSIADRLKQVQTMQNNTAKALFLDLAATGPMFWVRNASLLRDKSQTATQYSPYKTISFDEAIYSPGSTAAPIGVLDVPTKASQLIQEWDLWNNQADNDSGIPRFAEGQTAGQTGALRTSGGLAQIQENMMRGIKMVAMNFDNGIIKHSAKMMADYVLVYDDDMELKGDVYIRSVGMIGRILKSQREQRRLQVLNMVITNQFMQQLLGPSGILALFRPSLQDIDINQDDVVPSDERMQFMEAMEQLKQLASAEAQAPGGPGDAQAGAMQDQAQPEGAPPGVMQPPSAMPPGGVEERRSVA